MGGMRCIAMSFICMAPISLSNCHTYVVSAVLHTNAISFK